MWIKKILPNHSQNLQNALALANNRCYPRNYPRNFKYPLIVLYLPPDTHITS